MAELAMEAVLAARLEPDILQFEANAALWQLESDRYTHRLREDQAVGLVDPEHVTAAETAEEGLRFEIDRFQAFAAANPALDLKLLVRLAEVGATLEMARRRLKRALEDNHPEPVSSSLLAALTGEVEEEDEVDPSADPELR